MSDVRPSSGRTAAEDEEFSAFMRSSVSSLMRAAYALTGDQQLAEDLVQSALARTYLAWGRLRDQANAQAYARKVMFHLQISSWRRRRPAEALMDAPPELAQPRGETSTSAVTTRVQMQEALNWLTPKQRAILVLRYLEDRSERETAELLGISIGTVKSQTSHALNRMRTVVLDLGMFADGVRVVALDAAARRGAAGRRGRTAA
jgi:RNA polymerase sigma-70 factor (sigma-E family)